MLGMSDGQMQSFVVEQSTQSRARYRANCKAVFEYVEGMAERNELYLETGRATRADRYCLNALYMMSRLVISPHLLPDANKYGQCYLVQWR